MSREFTVLSGADGFSGLMLTVPSECLPCGGFLFALASSSLATQTMSLLLFPSPALNV